MELSGESVGTTYTSTDAQWLPFSLPFDTIGSNSMVPVKLSHLPPELQGALKAKGVITLRPIQEQLFSHIRNDKNLHVISGSKQGRSIGVLASLVDRYATKATDDSKDNGPRACVVYPMQEVATQSFNLLQDLCKNTGIKVMSLIGGPGNQSTYTNPDYCHILVGTPGKILGEFQKKLLQFSDLELLVLDEAHMLIGDAGAAMHMNQLWNRFPPTQKVFISNDIPEGVDKYLQPSHVQIRVRGSYNKLQVYWKSVSSNNDQKLVLLEILRGVHDKKNILVVTRHKNKANALESAINEHFDGATVAKAVHKDKERESTFARFNQGQIDILICCKLASSGFLSGKVKTIVCMEPMIPWGQLYGALHKSTVHGSGKAIFLWKPNSELEVSWKKYLSDNIVAMQRGVHVNNPPPATASPGTISTETGPSKKIIVKGLPHSDIPQGEWLRCFNIQPREVLDIESSVRSKYFLFDTAETATLFLNTYNRATIMDTWFLEMEFADEKKRKRKKRV